MKKITIAVIIGAIVAGGLAFGFMNKDKFITVADNNAAVETPLPTANPTTVPTATPTSAPTATPTTEPTKPEDKQNNANGNGDTTTELSDSEKGFTTAEDPSSAENLQAGVSIDEDDPMAGLDVYVPEKYMKESIQSVIRAYKNGEISKEKAENFIQKLVQNAEEYDYDKKKEEERANTPVANGIYIKDEEGNNIAYQWVDQNGYTHVDPLNKEWQEFWEKAHEGQVKEGTPEWEEMHKQYDLEEEYSKLTPEEREQLKNITIQ